MMEYQEAIEALELKGKIAIKGNSRRVAEFFEGLDIAIAAMQELQEYKQLGTLGEVRYAVEKQDPKKVKYMTKEGKRDIRFNCPNCATTFVTDKENEVGYCTRCGQKMDWSEQK